MKISIIAIGRMKKGLEKDLYERYMSRAVSLSKNLGIQKIKTHEGNESKHKKASIRKNEEGAWLLSKINPEAFTIALDETGQNLSSKKFTQKIDLCRLNNQSLNFLIGGADGHSENILNTAHIKLAFGAMTLPHQLARILLSEQLYRSFTIMLNHPYHRS